MASYLHFQGLEFSYPKATQLVIDGLTGTFNQGWSSICGVNGCGKTTLLNLLAGVLEPQTGSVSYRGKVVLVAQTTLQPPAGLADFTQDFDRLAIQLRTDLSISEDWYPRWESLSIGERKKLQLADALAKIPDILLVDEPTNHLDAQARLEVLAALQCYRGIGVLVSHDRLLLNQLCENTGFLDQGRLQIFAAPYDVAQREWQQLHQNAADRREYLKGQRKKLSQSIRKQSEKIDQGEAKLSKKGVARKDHDAKAKINLARLTGVDKSDSRKKHTLEGRRHRLDAEITGLNVKKNYDLGVLFGKLHQAKPVHISAGTIKRDYLTLCHPSISLNPGDKLAIGGPNGAGKTTMLTAWLRHLSQPYLFAPQELSQQQIDKLWKELRELEPKVKGKVMTLISCFGSNPKAINEEGLPSPGVWQKIMIAQAIVQAIPVLILDEPTNHMDLPAIEALEEALSRYEGILMFISHDEDFVAKLATATITVQKHGCRSKAVLAYP